MVTGYCGYWLSQMAWLREDPLRLAGQGRAVDLEADHVADIDGEIRWRCLGLPAPLRRGRIALAVPGREHAAIRRLPLRRRPRSCRRG